VDSLEFIKSLRQLRYSDDIHVGKLIEQMVNSDTWLLFALTHSGWCTAFKLFNEHFPGHVFKPLTFYQMVSKVWASTYKIWSYTNKISASGYTVLIANCS